VEEGRFARRSVWVGSWDAIVCCAKAIGSVLVVLGWWVRRRKLYGGRERRGVQSISKFGEAKDPGWELQPWTIFTLQNGSFTLELVTGLDVREKWQSIGG